MAGAIFIPITFLHFVLILLDLLKQKRRLLYVGYAVFSVSFILNFTPFFIKGVSPKLFFPFWPEAGIAFGPFLAIWLFYCFYPCLLLFKGYRQNYGVKRNQLKYFLTGIIIGFAGGSTNYFLWYNIPIVPYGNFFVPISIGMMAYAIVAYRLMDINVVITRGIAYGALTGTIAGTYIALMVIVDKVYGVFPGYNPTLGHALLFIAVFSALIFVLPRMKIAAFEITRNALFRGRYNYQQQLSEATGVIPTMLNLDHLSSYILTKIRETMLVNKIAIFLYSESEHNYYLLDCFGLDKDKISRIKLGENSPLAGLLRNSPSPLVREELEKIGTVPEETMPLAVEQLTALEAELCIPLMVKDDLIGIITLNNKKSGEMFTHEDLSLLTALAGQVALTVQYIKAIDKISSEKRYVGLGKAAMRMAHDIKNPLVPLKTFLQILPDKYPKEFKKMSQIDAEFTGRFYESALDGVDRINLLIERALHYARHPQPVFAQVDLNNLLDKVLIQENVKLKKARVKLKKEYASPENSFISADGEQLLELFSNLIGNSIEAMEESPARKLNVKTQYLVDRMEVEIKDTGCGIARDKIKTIFDPFITYKHQGSGLGLAIAKKIVDDHKGSIEVQSDFGKGTRFRVSLPVKH